MTKQRLSRAERSAQTRAELMASARQLFLRQGFHACSLEMVAEEAGFTIGAVYSRFGSKADLFLAILDERVDPLGGGGGGRARPPRSGSRSSATCWPAAAWPCSSGSGSGSRWCSSSGHTRPA